MTMCHEIVTDPLAPEDLWSDLRANIGLLRQLRVGEVRLLFGFAWGKHVYQGPWTELEVSLEVLEARVKDAEHQGFGRLGADNLYLSLPALEARVQYSHEADIHLSHGALNPFVEAVLQRWRADQWLTLGGGQR